MNRKSWILVGILVGLLVGMVSATTVVINCSRDGTLNNDPEDVNTTWETLHSGTSATTTTDPFGAGSTLWGYRTVSKTAPATGYDLNIRGIISFPTSAIPDGAIISSAHIYMYSQGGQVSTLAAAPFSLIDAYPTSYTDFVNGDYDGTSFTRQANDIPYASIPAANGTIDFTLTNYTFINKTGYTAYILTSGNDTDNTGFTWASNKISAVGLRSNSYAGTPYSPINMTVTYTTSPTAAISANVTDGNAPLTILFTDSSTETPTGWNWSFGDGSAVVTTQNPVHTFTNPGIYTVTHNATNAYGVSSDITTRIGVIDPKGWYDSFNKNTSSFYESQNVNFTWDTTNDVLNGTNTGTGTGAQLYYNKSPFFGGTYHINITPSSVAAPYYYTQFIFGSQSMSTGNWFTDSVQKYVVYMKKDPDEVVEHLVLARVNTDGTHDELVYYPAVYATKDHYLPQPYNLTVVWNPYSATNVINVSMNGTVVITSNDKAINSSGWAGVDIHRNVQSTTLYDDFWVNTNLYPTTIASYPILSINETQYLPNSDTNLPATGSNLSINITGGSYKATSFIIKPNSSVPDITLSATTLTDADGTGHTAIPINATDIKIVKAWYQANTNLGTTTTITSSNDPIYVSTMKYILTPEQLLYDDSNVRVNTTAQTNEVWISVNGTESYFHVDNTTIGTFPTYAKIYDNTTASGFPIPFTLSANENKQVWVTVKAPVGQAGGNYTGKIYANTSSGSTYLNLSVRVLNVTLQNATKESALYYHGVLPQVGSEPANYKLDHYQKTQANYLIELQDMKNHGVLYPTQQGYIGWAAADTPMGTMLDLRTTAGLPKDHIYMTEENLIGYDPYDYRTTSTQSRLDELAVLITEFNSIKNPKGYGYVYVMGVDEPSVGDVSLMRPSLTTSINNGTKTYYAVYPDGRAVSIANVTNQVNIAYAINETDAALYRAVNPSIKVFTYANPQAGVENPEIYRQNYGFGLWVSTFNGSMTYAYQQTFGQTIWNDFDNDVPGFRDHVFAYPKTDGVIGTIQWEGYREGVDDSRYADTLSYITGNTTEATTIINAGIAAGSDMSVIRGTIIDHILAYNGATIPTASFTKSRSAGNSPLIVQFNDTSTNLPTGWEWWARNTTPGNNTAFIFNISQNPIHTFNVGNWLISLNVSNAAGNATSDAEWINVSTATSSGTLIFNTSNLSDGYVQRSTGGTTSFYSIRSIEGTAGYNTTAYGLVRLRSANSATADKYNSMERGLLSINTSSIPDDATITSAKLSLYAYSSGNQLYQLGGVAYGITGVTLQTNGTLDLLGLDYPNFTNTRYSSDIANGSIVPLGWNNWTFNGAGIGNISKTGWTNLMVRNQWDIDNSTTNLTWQPYQNITQFQYYDADNMNNIPFLTIDYTAGGGSPPVASFDQNITSGNAPLIVKFTDTSTNTPTAWEWWCRNTTPGNDTVLTFSTAQNPTHTFTSGNWLISLNTSNVYGYDTAINHQWINTTSSVMNFTMNRSTCAPLCPVLFNDTSTPTPSTWSWSFYNYSSASPGTTVFSTARNVTHTFGGGNFSIVLTADGIAFPAQWLNVSAGNKLAGGLPASFQIFPADYIWNVRADTLSLHPLSSTYIASQPHPTEYMYMSQQMTFNVVDDNVTGQNLTRIAYPTTADWVDTYQIPDNSIVEHDGDGGETDHHYFSINNESNIMYEMGSWSYKAPNGTWSANSAQVYNLSSYTLRTDGLFASNAGGVPMGAGIVTCNEVIAGSIDHSLIIAVDHTQKARVWPARENGYTINSSYPPLGTRWRLKSTFNTSGYTPAATTILTGLKTYGATLSMWSGSMDSGYFLIYSEKDCAWPGTTPSALSYELRAVKIADFEIVNTTPLMININSGQANTSGISLVSAFSANTTSGISPSIIKFTDASTNIPTDWDWYWYGNETKSSDLQSPTATFTTGVYNVKLNASNAYAYDWENKTGYINITSGVTTPSASFTTDLTGGYVPATIHFTDTSTHIPTTWTWSFGDGGWSYLQNPSHTYSVAGTYSPALEACNSAGCNVTNGTPIVITVAPACIPDANFTMDTTSGVSPLTIHFTDVSTCAPTSWVWQAHVSGETINSYIQNPTMTLTNPGSWYVYFAAYNAAGSDSTVYYWVNVTPPLDETIVSAFHGVPTDGGEPLTVQFYDDSTGPVIGWLWSFGDGATTTTQNPSHLYATQGDYTVTLRAYNTTGSDLKTRPDYITVFHVPTPTPTPTLPVTTVPTTAPSGTGGEGWSPHMRNMAVTPLPTVPIQRLNNITEALFGGWNETNQSPNWEPVITNSVAVYTDFLGPVAFLLIFLIPFGMMWLAHGNMKLLSILGIIVGLFVNAYLPANYAAAAIICIVVAAATLVWSLFKQ